MRKYVSCFLVLILISCNSSDSDTEAVVTTVSDNTSTTITQADNDTSSKDTTTTTLAANEEYVFDLKNDMSEESNIIDTSKPIYDRLKSKFKEWEKDMIDPIFMDLGMGKEYNKLNPDRWYKSIKEKQ